MNVSGTLEVQSTFDETHVTSKKYECDGGQVQGESSPLKVRSRVVRTYKR